MSRNSSRMPGASISSIAAGKGPPRSGWQMKVSIAPAGVAIFLPTAAHQREEEEGTADIVDIAALKPRLFASISAIAAIDLPESFVNISQADRTAVSWQIAILLAFVVSGVLLAWMERLG